MLLRIYMYIEFSIHSNYFTLNENEGDSLVDVLVDNDWWEGSSQR